jgi:hypothetical protein
MSITSLENNQEGNVDFARNLNPQILLRSPGISIFSMAEPFNESADQSAKNNKQTKK